MEEGSGCLIVHKQYKRQNSEIFCSFAPYIKSPIALLPGEELVVQVNEEGQSQAVEQSILRRSCLVQLQLSFMPRLLSLVLPQSSRDLLALGDVFITLTPVVLRDRPMSELLHRVANKHDTDGVNKNLK